MSFRIAVFAIFIAIFTGILAGQQHAVDPTARYHRLICLVHLTGSGKGADAIRPEYAPDPSSAVSRAGIIAWSMQIADDGKMAIVQYVAVDRSAFKDILV